MYIDTTFTILYIRRVFISLGEYGGAVAELILAVMLVFSTFWNKYAVPLVVGEEPVPALGGLHKYFQVGGGGWKPALRFGPSLHGHKACVKIHYNPFSQPLPAAIPLPRPVSTFTSSGTGHWDDEDQSASCWNFSLLVQLAKSIQHDFIGTVLYFMVP